MSLSRASSIPAQENPVHAPAEIKESGGKLQQDHVGGVRTPA